MCVCMRLCVCTCCVCVYVLCVHMHAFVRLQLQWSLSLRGNLIVALEDASLIQVYADMNGASITVQGKRREILSPVTVSCHIVAIQEITMETNNVTTFWNQPDRCVHHSDSTKLIMLVNCRELFAFQ